MSSWGVRMEFASDSNARHVSSGGRVPTGGPSPCMGPAARDMNGYVGGQRLHAC